jgi:hypothetical protein
MTATPSVPPTSLVESLTAEPTPALLREMAPMMDSVAGVEGSHRDEPDGDDEFGPGPHGELSPGDRSDADRQRHREQAHPGRQGAVAADELEILGYQEDEAEQGEERHGDCAAGRAEPHVAEQPHVEHRVRGTPLARDERSEQDRRGREAGQTAPGGPSVGGRLDDGVNQQRHGG